MRKRQQISRKTSGAVVLSLLAPDFNVGLTPGAYWDSILHALLPSGHIRSQGRLKDVFQDVSDLLKTSLRTSLGRLVPSG